MQGPRGHKSLLCSTASNMMLSIDLAQGLKNGDKFRKSGPGLTVFSVKFCLQDFILFLHVIEDNISLLLYFHIIWKGHISSYSSHHIIERKADFILTWALFHLVNLLENVPPVTYMVGWICACERERRLVCVHTCGWVSIFINPSATLEELTECAMETAVTMERTCHGDELKKCLCKTILPCNLIPSSILKNTTGLEPRTLGSLSPLNGLPKQSRKRDDKLQGVVYLAKGPD